LGAVPQPLLPHGSALLNSTRFVVQVIGVALLAAILSSDLSQTTKDGRHQVQAAEQVTSNAIKRFGLCETVGIPPNPNIRSAIKNLPALGQAHVQSPIQQARQGSTYSASRGRTC